VADGPSRISDWLRDRTKRCRLVHSLVGAVPIVVVLELAQRAQEMTVVPGQGTVEEFVAQLLHPLLHDRVQLVIQPPWTVL
jgi:hypothetical protein